MLAEPVGSLEAETAHVEVGWVGCITGAQPLIVGRAWVGALGVGVALRWELGAILCHTNALCNLSLVASSFHMALPCSKCCSQTAWYSDHGQREGLTILYHFLKMCRHFDPECIRLKGHDGEKSVYKSHD